MSKPVCGKCHSTNVYLDNEDHGRHSIACLMCGNRWPGGKEFYMSDDVKLCEECGERETISKSSKLCASCMGKKGNAAQRDKTGINKKAYKDKGRVKIMSGNADKTVIIDFTSYEEIHNKLIELASQQIRTLDLQIIYMLKLMFDAKQTLSGSFSEVDKPNLQ